MTLTRKLLLALLSALVAVAAASAWISVRKQAALFDHDVRRDHVVLGHVLARDLSETLIRDGAATTKARALAFLGPREHVRIEWVSLKNLPQSSPLSAGERDRLSSGRDVSKRIKRGDGRSPDVLYTYVPVAPKNEHAVVVVEPLREEEQFLSDTVRHAVVSTLVLLIVVGGLAGMLGVLFVTRPIRAILAKIRRVSRGDLSGEIQLPQRDELGEIAQALNEMSTAIADGNQRLRQETQARIAAVEQLRHADRLMTVGKLASGVAHELGTPLSVISGHAEMTILSQNVSPEAKQGARIIRDQTHRMTVIIRQLLDFARKHIPRTRPVDLRAIVDSALAMLAPLAEKRNVTVRFVRPALETVAAVDAGQLQQVLTNLVANAVQACGPTDHVTVDLSRTVAEPPADVAGAPTTAVCITVADTGCGMTDDVLARAFEPFFTTKEVGEGTGLGLSVAYGIVREHGGWILATSRPGQGSTFQVFVPIAGPGIQDEAVVENVG